MRRPELIVKHLGLFAISEHDPLYWEALDDPSTEYTFFTEEEASNFLKNNYNFRRFDVSVINNAFNIRVLGVAPNEQFRIDHTNLIFDDIHDCISYMCIWQECSLATKLLSDIKIGSREFNAMVRYVRNLKFDLEAIRSIVKENTPDAKIKTKTLHTT
jgi:hypothetical protein